MTQAVMMQEKAISIDYSEVYSKDEVVQFFNCLSPEAQDELLTVMREMVAKNKAKQIRQN